ncbi:possible Negative factor, (F-Protein) or Nef [Prochlorococcus marinus str. MIT 9313]|uniref:Possible Negative factor, (F-Protein) or Nef n=1 Tax=Prochlorococcus marinus (strain MIT 9313) TaxID=74547 RepID=Q7TV69_PROMM|nr:hypothetical protein [Prochlorococcus marinus]CAE20343.1 possible Negative factor, (F-Protein) or Nef [Prochlorococcus marinus str. MIT 9313]
MKLANQATTRATRHESNNAFLDSARIESQDILPKVEVAPLDIRAQEPLVNAFEQNQPSLEQQIDQVSDGLFVGPAFNTDDINVRLDQLDMIDLLPLENLESPINDLDLLTGFNQDMLFDAKDMVNMINEIRDMAMSSAGAGWEGNHGTTWDGPFSGETQMGDSWSKWEGDGFETYYTHNGEETSEEEYNAAKKADDNGEYYTPSKGSSNSSDDDNDDENGNKITPEAEGPMSRGRWFIDPLVPEQLVSNKIEEIDVLAHQMPMFIGVQQATTPFF